MDNPNFDELISRLLKDLESDDAYRRKNAAETAGEQNIKDENIIAALKNILEKDGNKYVRRAAENTLTSFGMVVPVENDTQAQGESPADNSPQKTDYAQVAAGFMLWFLAASILAPFSFGLITTPLTIIALIAFGRSKTQKGIAGGILIAVSLNFVFSLVRGMTFNAWCFMPFFIGSF